MIRRGLIMRHEKKYGFTLIETIVAFAIIAIILVVALIGFNTIANVDNKAQGWNAADQTIETLIAAGGPGNDQTNHPDLNGVKLTITPGGESFSVSINGDIRTFVSGGKTITVFKYAP